MDGKAIFDPVISLYIRQCREVIFLQRGEPINFPTGFSGVLFYNKFFAGKNIQIISYSICSDVVDYVYSLI